MAMLFGSWARRHITFPRAGRSFRRWSRGSRDRMCSAEGRITIINRRAEWRWRFPYFPARAPVAGYSLRLGSGASLPRPRSGPPPETGTFEPSSPTLATLHPYRVRGWPQGRGLKGSRRLWKSMAMCETTYRDAAYPFATLHTSCHTLIFLWKTSQRDIL